MMPYVSIQLTKESSPTSEASLNGKGPTAEQKAELIKGVTDLLAKVLNKNPATTFVVIEEIDLENWGVGGLPVSEYRKTLAS